MFVKEEACPVCGRAFPTVRVRVSQLEVAGRDPDFCVHYKGINPHFYNVWVCPNCGYAGLDSHFHDLGEGEKLTLRGLLQGRRPAIDFGGVRTRDVALAAHKLALYLGERRGAPASLQAGILLRMAWICREAGDAKEQELLAAALVQYMRAYDRETFPIGKMSQYTVEYMIGELHLRTGKPVDAVGWFNRIVSAPSAAEDLRIQKMAREGWERARDANRAQLDERWEGP